MYGSVIERSSISEAKLRATSQTENMTASAKGEDIDDEDDEDEDDAEGDNDLDISDELIEGECGSEDLLHPHSLSWLGACVQVDCKFEMCL